MPSPGVLPLGVAALHLVGDLCESRADFEALGLPLTCTSTPAEGLPLVAEVVFASETDWLSARWCAPGASCVVLREPSPAHPTPAGLGGMEGADEGLTDLSQAAIRGALERVLARRRGPTLEASGWKSWALAGVESARYLHDLNNALSRALTLAEVASYKAPPALAEHLASLQRELLKAAHDSKSCWGSISDARRERSGVQFSDALWEAAQRFSWPSESRPQVLVAEEPVGELKASATEASILAHGLLDLVTATRCSRPRVTLEEAQEVQPKTLDFVHRHAQAGTRWLRARLEWLEGEGRPEPAERFQASVIALSGGGTWHSNRHLEVLLPIREAGWKPAPTREFRVFH